MNRKLLSLVLAVLIVTSSALVAVSAGEIQETEIINTGITTRVSVASDGTEGNGYSDLPSISADGRYVAFGSVATNLLAGFDTNGSNDIFVHDRQLGQTTLVSVSSDETQGNDLSYDPSISGDGRYVAFWSVAYNLVQGDTNISEDVFVHDLQTGETTRVSVSSNGSEGNGSSGNPSISGDGRYVAFLSVATNLVAGDTNTCVGWTTPGSCPDIFVHDRQTGLTTRVSVASDGTEANGRSNWRPSISADGRFVAFYTDASNLVNGDTNERSDVFVHDRQTGQTTRVSVASDGTEGDGFSSNPSISADGRHVAFQSIAANLVNGDTNERSDVFVHDRQTGQITRVSVASDGTEGNGYSDLPSISAEGRYVAFYSIATNLVNGDTNTCRWYSNPGTCPDVFVHDRQTGQTTRVSVASDGTEGNGYSDLPSISADGRYVAFGSVATNLVSGDNNNVCDTDQDGVYTDNCPDIFVHDRLGSTGIQFRPYPNGYRFENSWLWYTIFWLPYHPPEYDFSIDDMRRLFGDDAVCTSVVNGRCNVSQTAQEWYDARLASLYDDGHCDGMVATSLRFFKGWDQPSEFRSGALTTYDLSFDNARRNISYYQVLQATPLTFLEIYNAHVQTPQQVLTMLQDSFATGAADPYLLHIYSFSRRGHSLVPYLLTDRGGGTWWVWVYDPNFPDEANRHVVINTNDNTWSYTGSFGTWNGDAGSHTMHVVPLSVYKPVQIDSCVWCKVDLIQVPIAQASLSAPGGHMLFTDSSGRQLGYVGNQFVDEIPNAYAIPRIGSSLGPSEPMYYLPITNTYTIRIDGQTLTQTQEVNLRQFGPGYAAGIDRMLTPSANDVAVISQDGKQIAYQSNEAGISGFILTSDFTSTVSYKFNVSGVSLVAGRNITMTNDTNINKLAVNNQDGGVVGAYDLKLFRVSGVGEQVFVHANVFISANDTHYVNYGAWDGEGSLILEIDHGSDATVDESIVLDNELYRIYLPLIRK